MLRFPVMESFQSRATTRRASGGAPANPATGSICGSTDPYHFRDPCEFQKGDSDSGDARRSRGWRTSRFLCHCPNQNWLCNCSLLLRCPFTLTSDFCADAQRHHRLTGASDPPNKAKRGRLLGLLPFLLRLDQDGRLHAHLVRLPEFRDEHHPILHHLVVAMPWEVH